MKVILFDLGGTIFDNFSFDFENGLKEALKYSNISKDYHDFLDKKLVLFRQRKDIEIKIVDMFKEMENELNFKFSIDYENLENIFFSYAEFDHLMDGVEEALKVLYDTGYYLGIISNSTFSGNCLFKKVESFGIAKYFHFLISSADVGYRKPTSIIFEKGIEKVKEEVKDIEKMYYLGNDYAIDALGSSKVGLAPIWLNVLGKLDNKDTNFIEIASYKALIELINKNKI